MIYETVSVTEDPGAWLVEAIDHDSEGEVYSALFYGMNAEKRAREYAAWKSAQAGRESVNNEPQRR